MDERKDSILEILKKIDEDAYKRGFEDGKKAVMKMSDLATTYKWRNNEYGVYWECEKCGSKRNQFQKIKTGEICSVCKRLILEVFEG